MSKENAGEEEIIDDPEDLPEVKEGEEDKTDYKALAKKNHGIAQRYKTKLEKNKTAPATKEKPGDKGGENSPKAGELDRMDKMVLRQEKITSEAEVELVTSIMKETGKTVEQVLDSKYFQAELKEMRELAATKDATPDGTKRTGQSGRDTVEYWLAKNELPEDPALRTKVVNAKIAKEKRGNTFSKNPII